MTSLQKLAFDATIGKDVEGRNATQMNDAVRNAVMEACGGEWSYWKFMAHKYEVFEIIAEIMPVSMQASLAGKFDAFAEIKDTAMGDKNYFWIEDNETYGVATVARGNSDVSRQKIVDKNFSVPTVGKAIKLYDEFDRFMAGKITIDRLSEKAMGAMMAYVGELISNTIYNSYSAVGTNFKASAAFDADTLVTIIEHVKAATGATSVQIWGTQTSLSKVDDSSAAGYSDSYKDQFNGMGYFGQFRGTPMFELPQAYLAGGGQTFAVNDSYIIIVPAGEKIVKVVFEGEPLIEMTTEGRNDQQMEFSIQRQIGAASITAVEGKYGLYRFS